MAHSKKKRPKRPVAYADVSPKVYDALLRVAKADDRPIAWVVRSAIEEYLRRVGELAA